MPSPVFILIGIVVFVLAVCGWWFTRAQRRQQRTGGPSLEISVEELGDLAPPQQGPQLMVMNTPVWLAGVVLAPAGRGRALPSEQTAPAIADFAVPGLKEVMLQHRSRIFIWPAQVSSTGFTQVFARQVRLPGDAGRGGPWCSVAGSFQMHGVGYVMGLICRTTRADNQGQLVIPQGGSWLDIVRTTHG